MWQVQDQLGQGLFNYSEQSYVVLQRMYFNLCTTKIWNPIKITLLEGLKLPVVWTFSNISIVCPDFVLHALDSFQRSIWYPSACNLSDLNPLFSSIRFIQKLKQFSFGIQKPQAFSLLESQRSTLVVVILFLVGS
jgi:hypothetical protein